MIKENKRTEIGFGRLGINGFIQKEGEDLDIKKPNKCMFVLMLSHFGFDVE